MKAAIAWRGVRAEALARRGETREAVALARAGVDIAAGTDALLDHADARTALAAALRADGQHAEADAEEQCALELWEAKGAIVLVERARRTTEPSETARAGDRRPARVDAPSGSVVPSASRAAVRRPVAPNFATAQAQRLDAAVAASDRNAIRACFADDLVLDQRFYAVDQGHEEAAGPTQVALTASWQRFKITGTLASGQTGLWVVIRNFTGNGDEWTNGTVIYLWGARLQERSDPKRAYARTWDSTIAQNRAGAALGAAVVSAVDLLEAPLTVFGPWSTLTNGMFLQVTPGGELIIAGGAGSGYRLADLGSASNPSGWAGVRKVKTPSGTTLGYILLYTNP